MFLGPTFAEKFAASHAVDDAKQAATRATAIAIADFAEAEAARLTGGFYPEASVLRSFAARVRIKYGISVAP